MSETIKPWATGRADYSEREFLMSIMAYPWKLKELGSTVQAHHFGTENHRKLWEIINDLALNQHPLAGNLSGVKDYMKNNRMNPHEFDMPIDNLELHKEACEEDQVVFLADQVVKYHAIRDLASQAQDIIDSCDQGNYEKALAKLQVAAFKSEYSPDQHTYVMSEAYADWLSLFESRIAGEDDPGIMTGFDSLDRKTNGFKPGELIILCARTAIGKSAMACTWALNFRTYGPTFVFTMEMTKEEIIDRWASRVTGYAYSDIVYGAKGLDSWKAQRIREASTRLQDANLVVDTTGSITPEHISSVVEKFCAKHHNEPAAIIVDHIGLMTTAEKHGTREQQVAAIAKRLKVYAKELACPVIALSQLNRNLEYRTGKERAPKLADLRDSGEIEQSANKVLSLHRNLAEGDHDRQYSNETFCDILKNRNGPLGRVHFVFDGPRITFHERAYGHEEQMEEM